LVASSLAGDLDWALEAFYSAFYSARSLAMSFFMLFSSCDSFDELPPYFVLAHPHSDAHGELAQTSPSSMYSEQLHY